MKQFLIIGMGEMGKHLANKLDELGHEVAIIDTNAEVINILKDKYPNAFIGDCMQLGVLKRIGIKAFDICFVMVGGDFQASLEITNNLKELKAKYIITKSSSDIQSKFLKLAGANETIYPEKEEAERLAVTCDSLNILNFVDLGYDTGIYQIKPLKQWIGKKLKELDLRTKCKISIVAVEEKNGEETNMIIPDANFIIKENDGIYVVGLNKDIKKIIKK